MSEKTHNFVAAQELGKGGGKPPVETRMSLMLRPAKLIARGREMLCLLREVNGAQLRVGLFHPLPEGMVEFELPDGQRLPANLKLLDPHAALLTLDESFDPAMLRRDWSGFPARQVRINLAVDALLHVRETSVPMVIHNISQKGALIECGVWLRIEETIRIETDRLPPLYAWVRWRRHPFYGITFDQNFMLDELALLTAPEPLESALSDARNEGPGEAIPQAAPSQAGESGQHGRRPDSSKA